MTGPRSFSGPAPSPLLMKACELLDDFAWHELEPVLWELGKLVPPGRAIRRNEANRLQSSKRKGGVPPPERYKHLSVERRIQSGQRSIAREVVTGPTIFKIEKRDVEGHDGPVYYVRMFKLPARVKAERARRRAHRLFGAVPLADELLTSDVKALLGELTYEQLLETAIELANRQKDLTEKLKITGRQFVEHVEPREGGWAW